MIEYLFEAESKNYPYYLVEEIDLVEINIKSPLLYKIKYKVRITSKLNRKYTMWVKGTVKELSIREIRKIKLDELL